VPWKTASYIGALCLAVISHFRLRIQGLRRRRQKKRAGWRVRYIGRVNSGSLYRYGTGYRRTSAGGINQYPSSYSQSNPIGLKSNRYRAGTGNPQISKARGLSHLDFFKLSKGPNLYGTGCFRGDCAYQFRKSNRTAIGFSFINSNSGTGGNYWYLISDLKQPLGKD
jgi:hypothetical protein